MYSVSGVEQSDSVRHICILFQILVDILKPPVSVPFNVTFLASRDAWLL